MRQLWLLAACVLLGVVMSTGGCMVTKTEHHKVLTLLTEAETELTDTKEQLAAQSTELEKTRTELTDLRKMLLLADQQLINERDTHGRKKAEMESQLRLLTEQVKSLQERMKMIQKQRDDALGQIAAAEAQCATLTGKAALLESDKDTLNAVIKDLRQQNRELRDEILVLQGEAEKRKSSKPGLLQ